MVYQVYAGYDVLGRKIKVPQVFIPRIIRAQILAHNAQKANMLNNLHFAAPATPVTLADCQAVTLMVKNWVEGSYVGIFHQSVTVDAIHARSMEGLIVPNHTRLVGTQGSLVGDAMPPQTSLGSEWTTGLTGQRNRGEFHPFYPDEEDNTADGVPVDSYITAVEAKLTALITAATSAGYPLIVCSFRWGTWSEVAGVVVPPRWGSVGSRKIKAFA